MSTNPETWLSEQDRAKVVAAVRALPPMTDEQIASICEALIAARDRRLAEKRRPTAHHPTAQRPTAATSRRPGRRLATGTGNTGTTNTRKRRPQRGDTRRRTRP